jgi:hypothetical protein
VQALQACGQAGGPMAEGGAAPTATPQSDIVLKRSSRCGAGLPAWGRR